MGASLCEQNFLSALFSRQVGMNMEPFLRWNKGKNIPGIRYGWCIPFRLL